MAARSSWLKFDRRPFDKPGKGRYQVVEKYSMPCAQPITETQVLTSDVYLVAYLLTQQCKLAKVMKNERRRVAFLVEGERVAELRHAYRQGPVYLNVKFFRVQLLTIRRLMDGKQRSEEYGPDTGAGVRTAQA
jgi:hypothetical protein